MAVAEGDWTCSWRADLTELSVPWPEAKGDGLPDGRREDDF